jgi:hypothetical protein
MGQKKNAHRILAGKFDEMGFLGRPMSRSEYNIEVDLNLCRLTTYIYIYIYIYIYRTAPLTSRCCILNIYSTNICTEYFKHAA